MIVRMHAHEYMFSYPANAETQAVEETEVDQFIMLIKAVSRTNLTTLIIYFSFS